MLLGGQNDLNKTLSGNDMPGYPRVNSVPPRSLNCNGYSGDFSGNQQTSNNGSNGSQVPPSPSRTTPHSATAAATAAAHHTMSATNQQQIHSQIPPSPSHHQHTNGNSVPNASNNGGGSSSSHHTTAQAGPSPHQMSGSGGGTGSGYMSHTSSAQQHALQQQSPNHNSSQMMHPSNSHSHHMSAHAQDTDWSAWNNTQTSASAHHHHQHGEMFNQSDRVNLNTRLKTMILSKNDQKDASGTGSNGTNGPNGPNGQQNAQTGHFLSYSHHLRDVNIESASAVNNNSHLQSNADLCLSSVPPSEPIGGGGVPHWKSSLMEAKPPDGFPCSQQQQQQPQQDHRDVNAGFHKVSAEKTQHHTTINHDIDKNLCMPYGADPAHANNSSSGGVGGGNKSKAAAHKSALDIEKPIKKPAPKRQRKKPSTQTAKQAAEEKKASTGPFMPSFNKSEPSHYGQPPYPGYGAGSKYPNESSSPFFSPTAAASEALPPFQPDFNMKIKQEPLSSRQPYGLPATTPSGNYPMAQVKMEGYERNYQNFINYADYCQSQNNGHAAGAAGHHQDYGQGYNYPPYSPYHHHHQNYSNSPYAAAAAAAAAASTSHHQGMPNFSSMPSTESNEHTDIKPLFGSNSNSSQSAAGAAAGTVTDKDSDTTKTDLSSKLTNYEKDIPIHTYPNHGRFMDSSSHHNVDGTAKHKLDDVSRDLLHHAHTDEQHQHQHQQQETQPHPNETSHSYYSFHEQPNVQPTKNDELATMKALDGDDGRVPVAPSLEDEARAQLLASMDKTEKGAKPEVPDCDCFGADEKSPPEPGSYYTHLGTASSLVELRADMESRIGIHGRQLRIEKVIYTGKEGKTGQGCPLAKWIIRRADAEEKILCIVKRRQGHK